MGKTVTAPVTTGRTITYSVPGAQSIELNYVRFSYSSQNVMEGRQFVKRLWSFRFSFIISGSTASNLQTILVNCNKALNQRGGRLQVIQEGKLLVDAGPAGYNPVPSGNLFGTYEQDITNVMTDIGWGPVPGEFRVESIQGNTAIAAWTLNVESAAEDAYFRLDSLVVAISANVQYTIDQNHYTVRTVMGKVTVANWGRTGIDWNRSSLSQADALAVRQALIKRPVGSVGWIDPILIPPGFVRSVEDWGIDDTENVLTFIIIDREVYRGYPAYITNCNAVMQMEAQGTTAAQWLKHTLTGFCEAPAYVTKFRVLAACWEIILSAMSFLTDDNSESYVPGFSFTNHIYANRLDFSVTAYSPLIDSSGQVMRLDKAIGIGNYFSEMFFPQGEGGSAQLYGSAYRQEGNQYTRFSPQEENVSRDPRNEAEGIDDRFSQVNGDGKLLNMKLQCQLTSHANNTCVTSTGAVPKFFNYSLGGPSISMVLSCRYTQTFKTDLNNKKDYSKDLFDSLATVEGLTLWKTQNISGGVQKGMWRGYSKANDGFVAFYRISGKLYDEIIQGATTDAEIESKVREFANFLNAQFTTSEVTDTAAFAAKVAEYFRRVPITP